MAASTHSDGHDHGHDHGHGHDGEAHGGPKLYWAFAVVLCLITFCEWSIFKFRNNMGITPGIMVPALLGLSAVKFVMVVGWYMHLRYDPGWMKKIFVASLVMGGGTALVLVALMGKNRIAAEEGHPAPGAPGVGANGEHANPPP
jgi:cytochrome c oxidase subunit 4